jgi:hypothetical protein
MSDNDPSDDRDIVSRHVKDFVRSGTRTSSDELAGSVLGGLAAGAARGVGGLALAVAMPVAEKLGRELAGDDEEK